MLSDEDLEKIAQLAYLDCKSDRQDPIRIDLNAIMDFVEQLRKVDTSGISPLFHPLDLTQRLRADEITEPDCSVELAQIAPAFEKEEGYYLVAKVVGINA